MESGEANTLTLFLTKGIEATARKAFCERALATTVLFHRLRLTTSSPAASIWRR